MNELNSHDQKSCFCKIRVTHRKIFNSIKEKQMLSSRIAHRTVAVKKIVKILKFQKPFDLNISTIFQFLWRNKMLFNIPKQV